MEFYICVEEYKRIKDQIGLNKEGKKIATKFIYPSSESEINIDSAIRDKIVATTEFLVDTFDEAQVCIFIIYSIMFIMYKCHLF